MKIRSDGMEVSGYASTLFRGFPTFTDLHSPSSGVPSRVGCSYAETLLPCYIYGGYHHHLGTPFTKLVKVCGISIHCMTMKRPC